MHIQRSTLSPGEIEYHGQEAEGGQQKGPHSRPAPPEECRSSFRCIRSPLLPEQKFQDQDHQREEGVDGGDVPVEDQVQGKGPGQKSDPSPVGQIVDPQQDQRQQIDAVQPHEVAALGNGILHEAVAQRQRQHGRMSQPARKPPLQVVRKGHGRQPQLQGGGDIEKGMQLGPGKEDQQQVEGRLEIVIENGNSAQPQSDGKAVFQILFSRKDIFQIGIELQILDIRVLPGKRRVPEGRHLMQPVDHKQDPEGQKACRDTVYTDSVTELLK